MTLFDDIERIFGEFVGSTDHEEGLEELSEWEQEETRQALEDLQEGFRQFYTDLAVRTGNITKF